MENTFFYRLFNILLKIPFLQQIRILFYFFDSFILLWIRKPSYKTGKKKKVMITFPFALGDAVIFLSSLPHMEEIFDPESTEVTIACQKEYQELFADYFEKVLPLDCRSSSVSPFGRIRMLKQIRKESYDVAIDPIGCEECSPNVFFMNAISARKKIGVFSVTDKKVQCPEWIRKRAYTEILPNRIKNLHKVKYYTRFWEQYSGKTFAPKLEPFPYTYADVPEHYFIVFPSASLEVKQWSIEKYAMIACRIYEKTGWPLIVCGTEYDRTAVDEMLRRLPEELPVVDYVGKTSIKEFIGLIGQAELVLTNDTSAYHIAVVQKRKTCVVTGGYVYDTFIHYECEEYGYPQPEIICRKLPCMNCNNSCIYKVEHAYPCVADNDVEDVWQAVQRLSERRENGMRQCV